MADNLPALSRAADSVLNMIARAASDPAVDIGKLCRSWMSGRFQT